MRRPSATAGAARRPTSRTGSSTASSRDRSGWRMRKTVGILIFDDVEVLDFAGPFEVFSRTRTVAGADSRRSEESAPFDVFTVARTRGIVTAIGGRELKPRYGWDDAPRIDILVGP